ncbi:MAG TPA: hypothetical protein VJT31_23280 [Rugosimonospora sp.]|nr:hypothetical protein [Rugosimonospora sp.]
MQAVDVRLLAPLEHLVGGEEVERVRALVAVRAWVWAVQLLGGDEPAALGTVCRLVSALYPGTSPFQPPVHWWSTPVGRVVAHRFGHPFATSVSYPVAGAMLGVTRQAVHDLVARGKLARHPDGGVRPESVRDRLRGPTSPRGTADA